MNVIRLSGFLWQIVRQSRPNNTIYDVGRSIEYVLRLLPFYVWVRRLMLVLNHPHLQFVVSHQPSLLGKVRTPYLNQAWSPARRFEVVNAHHAWVLTRFNKEQIALLYSPSGLEIGRLQGQSGRHYRFTLLVDKRYEREGELSLAILSADHQRLATLTFAITQQQQALTMMIGGLQGGRDMAPALKQLAKDCHGLRTMALIVHIAQFYAAATGVSTIQAICEHQHIYRHRKYRKQEAHQIQRSYNQLWTELGGGPTAQGWYQLPMQPVHRGMEEIPSHKRAMYQRRHLLLSQLERDMSVSV